MPKPDSFTDNRDDLLSMALERLRKEPLPATAIEGPTIQAFREKENSEKNYKPKVVFIEPSEGKSNVSPNTKLRIRFDKPMHPSTLQLEWKDGGFYECAKICYDQTRYEFTIPIHLEAGSKHRIVINPDSVPGIRKGFQSTYRTGADSLTWTFSTHNDSRKKIDDCSYASQECSRTDKAKSVVERFNKKRRSMWAFVEIINTQEYCQPGPEGYQSLRAYSTQFTINGDHEICADIGEMIGMPLFVLCEGHLNHISGYYRKTPDIEEAVFCLYEEITDKNIIIADPFNAMNMDVNSTIQQFCLQYGGQENIDGKLCDVICSITDSAVSGKSALPKRQWWIEQQGYLLTRMVDSRSDGSKVISRFSYTNINKALNFMSYIPDVSYLWISKNKTMEDPLEKGYSGRFIEVCDGTRGNVCGAWGNYGNETKNAIGIINNGG